MKREHFWNLVCSLCDEFDGSVTSGYRTSRRNYNVGGAANSRHLKGFAADVVLDDWTKKAAFVKTAQGLGLRVLDEVTKRNHLHLDVDPTADD